MIVTNSNAQILLIGHYKVLKLLKNGSFGTIYLVQDTKNIDKLYIIKYIKSEQQIYRIDREISILKYLNNCENSLKLYGVKQQSNSYFLLLEYANGGTLKDKILKNGTLDGQNARLFIKDILKILKYSHKKFIVHQDIKPENIVIKDNQYYLIDWNMALVKDKITTSEIKNDQLISAPEIYYGSFDKSFDIYSLGCTIFFALTGVNVYGLNEKNSFIQKMYSHIYLHVDIPNNLSDKLKYLLYRMLDKNPQTRATIEEIEEILDENYQVVYDFFIHNDSDNHNVNFNNKFELYTKMANDGIAYAQTMLGLLYQEGYEGIEKNIDKAILWYKKASEHGLSKAQFNLGVMYFNNSQYKDAYENFVLASNNNHGEALYYLGLMYESGLFVKSDFTIANNYFKKSAINGFIKGYEKLK